MSIDAAPRYATEISDDIMSTSDLALVFMTCARMDLNPIVTRNQQAISELRGVLSPDLMPTAKDFAAVYLATGTTEQDRVGRWGVVPSYRPTAVTESSWCRATLKRAAMREQVAA